MQKSGLTVAEVAESMGVSVGTVERYLSDGRFYAFPDLNMDRLLLACEYYDGLTREQSKCSVNQWRRARVDSCVLAHLDKL